MKNNSMALQKDTVVVLETNIDDMSPQLFESVEEKLFEAGAFDVWIEHIQMKKNRPAFKLCCISVPEKGECLASIIMEETTSIGVRFYEVERFVLPRKEQVMSTKFGEVAVKTVILPSGKTRTIPEYEACKELARKNDMSFLEVYQKLMAELIEQTES